MLSMWQSEILVVSMGHCYSNTPHYVFFFLYFVSTSKYYVALFYMSLKL